MSLESKYKTFDARKKPAPNQIKSVKKIGAGATESGGTKQSSPLVFKR